MASAVRRSGAKLALLTATAVLHLTVYGLVNVLNGGRPPSDYLSARTPVDDWIPYLPWTAVVYYLGDLFILLGGGAVVWRLGDGSFGPALKAYAGVIVTGGAIQLLLPIPGPWPEDPSALQRFFHALPGVAPYAALPSMHVALATLPAMIGWTSLTSRPLRLLLVGTALVVALSTLTTKEHFVLDVVAGGLLGLAGWAYWRSRPGAGRQASPQAADPSSS